MNDFPVNLLIREAERFGVTLDSVALNRLETYGDMLAERNKVVNLTAITDPRGIALKHFADSLSLFSVLNPEKGARVIDVGTGAGFPGVVLLIARPDLKLTFLDGTGKKLAFISDVLKETGLSGQILHARAEEAGKDAAHREQYDLATARAVANLRELAEYCLPFVRVGGTFASMKGAKAQQELEEGRGAVSLLGGEISSCNSLEIEDCGERSIILVKKISQTSPKYPRVSAQIAKRPL